MKPKELINKYVLLSVAETKKVEVFKIVDIRRRWFSLDLMKYVIRLEYTMGQRRGIELEYLMGKIKYGEDSVQWILRDKVNGGFSEWIHEGCVFDSFAIAVVCIDKYRERGGFTPRLNPRYVKDI